MKIRIFPLLIIGISLVWLTAFTIYSYSFYQSSQVYNHIKDNISDIANMPFYEKSVRVLEQELQYYEKQSFTTKSTSEFIAKIPKLGEDVGIPEMKIENSSVKRDNDVEITELKITAFSYFRNIAEFIRKIEDAGVPLQIYNLSMKFEDSRLSTVMSVRIFKKIIGE